VRTRIERPKYSKTKKKWIGTVESNSGVQTYEAPTKLGALIQYKALVESYGDDKRKISRCDGTPKWYSKELDNLAVELVKDPTNEPVIKAMRAFTQAVEAKMKLFDYTELIAKVREHDKLFATITQGVDEGTKISAKARSED
jgi:hypothetical protein